MNWYRNRFIQPGAFGSDPFDDPLNMSWDAVVRHERAALPDSDPDDVAFLHRVHALESVSLPSPSFFGELEQRLARLYPPPVTDPARLPLGTSQRIDRVEVTPTRIRSTARNRRWFSMQGALAALSVMLVASLFVLYQVVPRTSESDPPAIPAATNVEPTMESMVQLDFDSNLLGMPEATTWGYMEFNLIALDPGKSFSTDIDWYTWVDGPSTIMVVSGELTVQPAGPALFYPANRQDQTPKEIPSGQTVSLGPDDAIVYASVDSAAGSNSGSEPVVAVIGNIGKPSEPGLGPDAGPLDVQNLDGHFVLGMQPPPTAGASISIQRLQLAPFDSFVFEPDADWTYLCVFDQFQLPAVRMADGAFDSFSPTVDTHRVYSSTQLTFPDPGPHTLFNLGEKTVDIYFLVVEPATPPA
jgi:hypothetical protein